MRASASRRVSSSQSEHQPARGSCCESACPVTALLQQLFTSDATYIASPFESPIRGRLEIASFWEAEREGTDESFSMDWEPVAVENNVGVARIEVRYGSPTIRIYRDVWIVTLDEDGLCSSFEEWSFFPGQPRSGDDAE